MWYPHNSWLSDFGSGPSLRHLFRSFDRVLNEGDTKHETVVTTLFETTEGYEFSVELPGVKPEDVTLDVEGQALTLGIKRTLPEREGWAVHRHERRPFEWKRTWSFPVKLDTEQAKASLKDGLLTVQVAKAPEHQPRRIQVTV